MCLKKGGMDETGVIINKNLSSDIDFYDMYFDDGEFDSGVVVNKNVNELSDDLSEDELSEDELPKDELLDEEEKEEYDHVHKGLIKVNLKRVSDDYLILKNLYPEYIILDILSRNGIPEEIYYRFKTRNNEITLFNFDKDYLSNDELYYSRENFKKTSINFDILVILYYTISKNLFAPDFYTNLINQQIMLNNLNILIKQYMSKLSDSDKYFTDEKVDKSKLDIYYMEKINLESSDKIHIIGDIHGSIFSFISSLIKIMDNENKAFKDRPNLILKDNHYLFFTGDLIDYNFMGLEILDLVIKFKIKNPNNVFLIDGNHEDYETYSKFYFLNELKKQAELFDLYLNTVEFLNILPTVIFININGKRYQLNHGSICLVELSKEFNLLEYLESDKKYYYLIDEFTANFRLIEFAKGYKWGDFSTTDNTPVYGRPKFNLVQVLDYLKEFKIDGIIGGHQDLLPMSVLPKSLEQTDLFNEKFKFLDTYENYPLFYTNFYNLLSFPGNIFTSDEYKNSNDEEKRDYQNIKYELYDYNKDKTGFAMPQPLNDDYQYYLSLSDDNSDYPRILSLIQSQAGFSQKKYVPFYSVSTIF